MSGLMRLPPSSIPGLRHEKYVAAMFAAGEQGAWYDPSDLSALFQDAAGTVPVTAVEQPVGLMLDKSGRGNHATQATTTKRPVYSRRVNLISGSEATGGSGGSPGTAPNGWIIHVMSGTYAHTMDGDKHRFAATAGRSTVRAEMVWLPGVTYTIKVNLVNNAPVNKQVYDVIYPGFMSGTGSVETANVNGSISTTIPPGIVSVTITGSYTGGTPLAFLYFGVGAGGISTGDVTLIDVSVTLATDAHLSYQWVNTATDYDADPAKFPAYLRFDGVDDALQTGNIDFTGTDKMTVWAGVTKLSDAAAGMLFEASNGSPSNRIAMRFPHSGNDFSFASGGTLTNVAISSGSFAAPFTATVSGLGDISGDLATLRGNGTQAATNTADQGTGNYGNYPLFIGARAGTSFYFNGRLYSLIVRGAATPLPQIEATEAIIKKKMQLP